MRTVLIATVTVIAASLTPCIARAGCAELLANADGIDVSTQDPAISIDVREGSSFELSLAGDPTQGCLWLRDGPRGPMATEATITPCEPAGPPGQCAQVQLANPLPLLQGRRAWFVTTTDAIPLALTVASYHPCGARPAANSPPDHELRDVDEPGIVDIDLPVWVPRSTPTCVWIDDNIEPTQMPSGCDERAACVRLSGLQPGEHTVITALDGDTSTTVVRVPQRQCVLPAPSDGPRTPVRLVDGKLRVYLDNAPPTGSTACLTSPGSGLTAPLVDLTAQPCGGATAKGCMDVSVPPLANRWTLGVYDVDVVVGDGTPQHLSLRLMHSRTAWVSLYLLALLGLLFSSGFLFAAQRYVGTGRFSRRLERMKDQLRNIDEDNEPLVAKVRALLVFASYRLNQPWWSLRRAINFAHFEPALRHAEQLMHLSARKRSLWRQAAALSLPPTSMIRFNRILRQLDEDMLRVQLPIEQASLDALVLPAEVRCTDLLTEANYNMSDDVNGNLATLNDPLPPPLPIDDARDLHTLLTDALAEEHARLATIAARTTVAPIALREADIRMDVARAIQVALTRLKEPYERPDLAAVRRALGHYREVDMREPQAHSVHIPMLLALRWRPFNRKVAANLLRVPSSGQKEAPNDPLSVRIVGPSKWATFAPQALRLKIVDAHGHEHWVADTYLWRRLLQVEWTAQVTEGLSVRAGAERPATWSKDRRTATWRSVGPATVAFATEDGRWPWSNDVGEVTISAKIRAPGAAADTWQEASDHVVSVYRSEEERLLRGLQLDGVRRVGVSMVLTAAIAGVLAWQATQGTQGELPYIWAFLLPFGVDMTTVAIPNITSMFSKFLAKRG